METMVPTSLLAGSGCRHHDSRTEPEFRDVTCTAEGVHLGHGFLGKSSAKGWDFPKRIWSVYRGGKNVKWAIFSSTLMKPFLNRGIPYNRFRSVWWEIPQILHQIIGIHWEYANHGPSGSQTWVVKHGNAKCITYRLCSYWNLHF